MLDEAIRAPICSANWRMSSILFGVVFFNASPQRSVAIVGKRRKSSYTRSFMRKLPTSVLALRHNHLWSRCYTSLEDLDMFHAAGAVLQQ